MDHRGRLWRIGTVDNPHDRCGARDHDRSGFDGIWFVIRSGSERT